MRRLLALTAHDALVAAAGILVVVLACLSPVHNDTWWHLAYGREMAALGGFAQVDRFSHVAAGAAFPNHQWLAERLFYALFSMGGLPLLTAFCAGMLTTGWVLVWRLSRGAALDRLLIVAAAAGASTQVWSIRPQVFTLALLPLAATLLARGRLLWLPALFALWANLHGGVLLGLVVLGAWTATTWLTREPHRWVVTAILAASGLATCLTPLGLRYWPEIVQSVRRSQVHRLQEWQAPDWPPDHLFFWGMAAALLVLGARHLRRLKALPERAMLLSALALLPPASRTLRNIAPFVMLAAPSLTVLLESRPVRTSDHASPWRGAIVAALAVLGMTVVGLAWSRPWAIMGWEPMSPAAAGAIADCPGPLYNTYAGGGPIIWFVPTQPVFVDSRQDHLPAGVVEEATEIERTGHPGSRFAKYRFTCAAVAPSSRLATRLEALGWQRRYQDARWVVLVDASSAARIDQVYPSGHAGRH